MTIQLRLRHLLFTLAIALAMVAACGKVHNTTPDVDASGSNDNTCAWDQSTWDNCVLGP